MRRFYCVTCQKIKHVRVMPDNVTMDKDPLKREGECRWHDLQGGMIRQQAMDRNRVHHPVVKTHKISAAAQRSKSKKG